MSVNQGFSFCVCEVSPKVGREGFFLKATWSQSGEVQWEIYAMMYEILLHHESYPGFFLCVWSFTKVGMEGVRIKATWSQ